jgi:hypothetical protein
VTKKNSLYAFLEERTPGTPIAEQAPGVLPKLEKPLAKSRNPEYGKVGVYLRISTIRQLKRHLAGDELSSLFEQLADQWLKTRVNAGP